MLKKIFPIFLAAIGLVAADIPQIPVTPDDEAGIQNLGPSINTRFVEYTPFILPDESMLIFESNRPGSVGISGDFDLWYSVNADKTGKAPEYQTPLNFNRPVNTEGFDGLPSLRRLPDGSLEMYFTSFAGKNRPGFKETNIYYTRQVQGKWTEPKQVDIINSDFHDRMPSIAPDGQTPMFSSNRPGGYGQDDIWICRYNNEKKRWSKPKNAGAIINTPASEVSPSIHSDSITLYFSSDRKVGVGGFDIYVTQKLVHLNGAPWKKPQNLGKPYNSLYDDEYPTVTRNGLRMYFTSNRKGGAGSFDIYRANVPEFAKPEVLISYAGKVHEADTTKGIEANIRIRSEDGDRNISTKLPDGNYTMDLINDKIYTILVTAPGYEPYEEVIDLRDNHKPEKKYKNFTLHREFTMPEAGELTLVCRDEAGQVVYPNVTYSIEPESPNPKIFPLKEKQFQLRLHWKNKFQKKADFLEYLEKNKIRIQFSGVPYQEQSILIPLKSIFRPDSNGNLLRAEKSVLLKRAPKEKTKQLPPKPKQPPSKTAKNKERTTTEPTTSKASYRRILVETFRFEKEVTAKSLTNENERLQQLYQRWQKEGQPLIEVQGHTDRKGSLKKNMRLSRERALNMKQKLVAIGIPKEKIRPAWFAYRRPLVEEVDEKTKAQNRRVEIYFLFKK